MTDNATDLREVKAALGPVGLWLSSIRTGSAEEIRSISQRIEALGFGSLWHGEVFGGREAFAFQSLVLSATSTLIAGTGIANLWVRHPVGMEGGAATLGEAYPRRFILGIGVSHAPMVNNAGSHYEHPLSVMREYLDQMDAAKAHTPKSDAATPRVLAALRPKMLELARDRADGAHTYFVTPEHTKNARDILGPDKLLIPEQAMVLETDSTKAREIARSHMERYLRLPNYVNNLLHLGWANDDVVQGGSDALVDAIVAWGTEEQIAARIAAHRRAGADHVLLQPLGLLDRGVDQIEVIAASGIHRLT